jgi:hypothetical protein
VSSSEDPKTAPGVQAALQFIARLRRDGDLAAAVRLARDVDALVAVASSAGVVFTPEMFTAAFAHDWSMRWMASRRTK